MLGAAADLSQAAGNSASAFINASTSVVASASEVVSIAAVNSLSIGANVWNGVDVVNVSAQRCRGQLTVDSALVLEVWLNSTEAALLLPCVKKAVAKTLVASAGSVSTVLPSLSTDVEDLMMQGDYGALRVATTMGMAGQLDVYFELTNVSFGVQWANPLWEHLGYPAESRRDQILQELRSAVAALPSKVTTWEISLFDPQVPLLSLIYGRLQRLGRLWWLVVQLMGESVWRCGWRVLVVWLLLPTEWQASLREKLLSRRNTFSTYVLSKWIQLKEGYTLIRAE